MTHDPHKPTVALDDQPDSWHMHTSEEGMPQEEHGSQARPFALIGAFVGSFAFVAGVIVACIAYFQNYTTTLRAERIENTRLADDYHAYKAGAEKHLAAFGWANPEAAAAGKVSTPLDQAMQRVIQQYHGNQGGSPRAEAR
ncbi:MAG: hypothetical protein WD749_06445 [Phycisphaerales bacterium]